MANDTRDGAATAARASATTAVLDEAHIGDIRGALGTISQHDVGARQRLGRTSAHPRCDYRPGHHRHGGGQRRWRSCHLLPGGPKLRHQPFVGVAAANPGARCQPGNGRPARRGNRRGPCPAHKGALRPLLGDVLGGRPTGARFPHDRHRVHRRRPRPWLFRREQVHFRSYRGGGAWS